MASNIPDNIKEYIKENYQAYESGAGAVSFHDESLVNVKIANANEQAIVTFAEYRERLNTAADVPVIEVGDEELAIGEDVAKSRLQTPPANKSNPSLEV